AMSHYHYRFAQRKFLFDGVELLSQDSCLLRIRIAAWIAVEPKLVIPSHVFVGAKINQHRYPGDWCIHETMDDEQDGLVRIVRFEPRDTGGRGIFLRPEETG